jgi:hypothetical protein
VITGHSTCENSCNHSIHDVGISIRGLVTRHHLKCISHKNSSSKTIYKDDITGLRIKLTIRGNMMVIVPQEVPVAFVEKRSVHELAIVENFSHGLKK